MGIHVTCDICEKEIDGGFVRVISDFYTVNNEVDEEIEPISYCTKGDEFIVCDHCYETSIVKKMVS